MRKNVRKCAAGLAALMIAGALTGCGGTDVEALQAENEQLQATVAELTANLEAVNSSIEYLEASAHDANAALDQVQNKMNAYSLLIAAQNAYIDFDREKVEKAMDNVEPYLQYLDGADLNAYYMILEYLEQPYNGTDTEMP